MVTPAPTQALQNINLNVKLGALASVSVLSKVDHSYSTQCINPSTDYQSVLCPVPNPGYRNISSVINVTYSYSNLRLAGTLTAINLDYTGSYSVNRTLLGLSLETSSVAPTLPTNMTIGANDTQAIQSTISEQQAQNNQDPSVALDVHSLWLMTQTALSTFSMNSSKIANVSNIIFSLDAESCLDLEATDTVYQLGLSFNSSTFVTANGLSGSSLSSLAQNITADGTTIFSIDGVISFRSTVNLIANMIFTKITKATPATCEISTAAPTPPPQLTSGINRYGVVTDSVTGKNSLGVYYGFNSSSVNKVFNYDSIDKYYALVTSDSCFKVKVWIVIPIFIGVIIFPLWINTDIIKFILNTLAAALTAVTSTFLSAITAAEGLTSQISAKNLVAQGVKAEAAARALTTEEGMAALVAAAEAYANKQIAKVKAATDYNTYVGYATTAANLMDKAKQVIDSLSAMDAVLSILDGNGGSSENTAKALLQAIVTANNAIDTAFQEFSNLVDKAPDGAIKKHLQETIRAIIDYLQYLDNLAKQMGETLDKTNPVEIVIAVLLVLIDVQGIKKFFHIAETMNLAQIAYDVVLEQVDQLGAIKLGSELAEIGAKQQKTALEKDVIGLAEDAAAAVDDVANAAADVLQINQIKNLANAGINLAASGVNAVAGALGSASSGIDGAKRDHIRDMISAYLIKNLDIYKITRLGHFDENHPSERQILINDLAGTRIYSSDGSRLLFERKDFCKNPFVPLGNNVRLNDFGCQSDTDPCEVGGYNCQELNYWYDAFKYRVSFDFYGNHDLSLGGVVIGDFDGDGVDDIMCHLPSSTKDYDKITKDFSQRTKDDSSEVIINNEIIYSPLKPLTSNGRFESLEQSMLVANSTSTDDPQSQKDWCKNGLIKAGDFNGDKKDDLLCITLTNSSLLYSNGYTFTPASNSIDGVINLINVTSASASTLSKLVIITGDFDGDGYTDVLNIMQNSADIFYGDEVNIFIRNSTKTKAWLSSYNTQLTSCYNVGVNRIIVEDMNNDGKDDFACVSSDNKNANTIYSTLPTVNKTQAIQASQSNVQIYINDVTLSAFDLSNIEEVKQNLKVNHQTHRNLKAADGVLISYHDMPAHQKSVSDVKISLDCLNLSSFNSEVYISFSQDYVIPENLLWNSLSGNNQKSLLLNLDVSAEFAGQELVSLVSSNIHSFEYKLEAVSGGCYNTETLTHTLSFIVAFNATAKMTIEYQNNLVQGKDLESAAANILPNFNVEDGVMAVFPVTGQVTINVLGVGYDVVDHCGN